jgi:hypothetical protein
MQRFALGLLLLSPLTSVAIMPPRAEARAGSQNAQPRDYTKLDVCRLVPADSIARALGGTVSQARPTFDKTFSRCTYILQLAGKPAGYVVWLQPAEDFEELKKHIEEPLTAVSGLGDAAYMFHDKGDGRFKINVLKRGDLMFQATGESAASARRVADVVVAELWKKTP